MIAIGKINNMNGKILIRCNAGIKLGLGHLSRCAVLIQELQLNNFETRLLIKTDSVDKVYSFLRSRNLMSSKLNFLSMNDTRTQEINDMKRLIQNDQISFVIIDHYDTFEGYFSSLKQFGVSILQFDYSGNPSVKSDIILNPNPGAIYIDYDHIQSHQKVLRGLKYALIDESFKRLKKNKTLPQKGQNIVFALGSSSNATDLINSIVCTLNDLKQTAFNFHIPEFNSLDIADYSNINLILYSNHDQYITAIKKADLVVCNAGVTATEMLYLNKKIIVLTLADNQRLNWRFYKENIGFAYEPGDFLNLLKAEDRFFTNRLHLTGRINPHTIPDGKGANRVVKQISNVLSR